MQLPNYRDFQFATFNNQRASLLGGFKHEMMIPAQFDVFQGKPPKGGSEKDVLPITDHLGILFYNDVRFLECSDCWQLRSMMVPTVWTVCRKVLI